MLSGRHQGLKWQFNRTLPISSKSLISISFEPARVKIESAPKMHCRYLNQPQKGRNNNGCIRNFTWERAGDSWGVISCEDLQDRISQTGFPGSRVTFL